MRTDSIIDSRDLAKRQQELQDLKDALEAAREERQEIGANPASTAEEIEKADEAVESAEAEFGEEEAKELESLNELESEVSEWNSGATLIHEDHFEAYAKELLEDCGTIPRNLPWYIVIDWAATADNLKADYSEVTHEGETYLVRS